MENLTAAHIVFSFDGRLLLLQVVLVLFTSTVAWLIRTNAMKHIDASVVAVMMAFSAVVTAALSVLTGTDPFTLRLVAGVVLGVTAIILSGLGDQLGKRKAGLPAET